MSGVDSGQTRDLVEAASEIVAAYSSHNHVSASDLPALIASVYASLAGLTTPRTTQEAASASPDKPAPAQIRKSITPDALTSFLDGKPYKTLKRHLRSHGLDPAAYRERYGLPLDYPMVASNYSAQRSELSSRRQIMAQGSSADQVAE